MKLLIAAILVVVAVPLLAHDCYSVRSSIRHAMRDAQHARVEALRDARQAREEAMREARQAKLEAQREVRNAMRRLRAERRWSM